MCADRHRAELAYPREWEYRVVGTSRDRVRATILDVTGGAEQSLTFSRFSESGKYISFVLEMEVRDEAHRNAIYRDLADRSCIKAVL